MRKAVLLLMPEYQISWRPLLKGKSLFKSLSQSIQTLCWYKKLPVVPHLHSNLASASSRCETPYHFIHFESDLETHSISPHQSEEDRIQVLLDSNMASCSCASGPQRQPSATFFFFFFLMQLEHKTLFLFSQKTTHEVFSFTFPKLFFIGNNVFALVRTSQERLSLIRPVLKNPCVPFHQ